MTTNNSTLVLLRHGESEWNAKNLFTGWVDVDLTDTGRQEATRGGELLANSDLLPDVVHTSLLTRAIRTSQPISRENVKALSSCRMGSMRKMLYFRTSTR